MCDDFDYHDYLDSQLGAPDDDPRPNEPDDGDEIEPDDESGSAQRRASGSLSPQGPLQATALLRRGAVLMTTGNGWKVAIREEPGDFLNQVLRLIPYRTGLDGTMVEVLCGGGEVTTVDVSATADPEPGLGFLIPSAALPGLRDAIDERMGRRYDEALVVELRASLDVERRRVDRMLDARVDR